MLLPRPLLPWCGSGLPDLPLMWRGIFSRAPKSKNAWSSSLGLPAIPKPSSIPQAACVSSIPTPSGPLLKWLLLTVQGRYRLP
jgi:hypothetical protein